MNKNNTHSSQNKEKPYVGIILQLIILFVVFAALSSSLKNGFVSWDDTKHLLENEQVRELSLNNIKKIFTSTIINTYTPLTILSFSLEYAFAKYSAFVFHLNNLLLHLGVTLLVFQLGRRMGFDLPAAFFGSLLFGIHPMHVESFAWITERKDVLYAFFYLLALLSYHKYLEGRRWGPYVMTAVFGLLSILAKSMALSLPLILLLCDWFYGRTWSRKIFLEKIPFFIISIAIASITFVLNVRPSESNFAEGALIWVWTLIFYLKKFLIPTLFVPLYQAPEPVSFFHLSYLSSLIVFVGLIVSLVKFRRQKLFLFAFLYYFLSIFFLLRSDFLDPNIVADRFMYLPSLGICLLLGVGLSQLLVKLKERRSGIKLLTGLIVGALFLGLGIKSYAQCQIWKDGVVLWTHVIQHFPGQPRNV